jgi:hypothetical protein
MTQEILRMKMNKTIKKNPVNPGSMLIEIAAKSIGIKTIVMRVKINTKTIAVICKQSGPALGDLVGGDKYRVSIVSFLIIMIFLACVIHLIA